MRGLTMQSSIAAILLFGLVLVGVAQSRGVKEETCGTTFQGCSVEKGECVCGELVDCTNPYPYKDLAQCTKDIKGLLDKCRREPCAHGQCVQTKQDLTRRWECACAGSGFYGRKCEIECPAYDKESLPVDYPSDCVY